MKIVNYLLVIGILIAALSCSDSQPKDKVALTVTQDSLRFMIPDDVKGPMLLLKHWKIAGKLIFLLRMKLNRKFYFMKCLPVI